MLAHQSGLSTAVCYTTSTAIAVLRRNKSTTAIAHCSGMTLCLWLGVSGDGPVREVPRFIADALPIQLILIEWFLLEVFFGSVLIVMDKNFVSINRSVSPQ